MMRYTSILTITIIFNLLAYALIKLRAPLYKNDVFKPMLWNMKLSIIPIFIIIFGTIFSLILLYVNNVFNVELFFYLAILLFMLTLLAWIVFLPNSTYLITELNLTHRSMDKNEVPIWYDIISVLSLSLSGIFNTIFGIFITQIMYLIYFDPNSLTRNNEIIMTGMAAFIILLVSIGVYLGREIRFNTWDLLHPIDFLKKLKNHFKKKEEVKNFILFTVIHFIFLFAMYLAFSPSFS